MYSITEISKACVIFFVVLAFLTPCYQAEQADVCKMKPCGNKGICVQTSISPGYKCQCYGTGYYGSRCKQKCPKFNDQSEFGKRKSSMPIECIVI